MLFNNHRENLRFILSALLWLAVFSSVISQPEGQEHIIRQYLLNHLPVENQNWEISQNPVTGFIYFANSEGLIEYNGISSRLFTLPFKQGIRSVYINKTGTIFTGSFEDFGFWEENNQGGLVYHSLARGIQVLKNDEIWNILEKDGIIYFQSFTSIYAFSSKGVQIIPGPGTMLFLFKTGNDFIVQAIDKGLYRFNGSEFTFIQGSQAIAATKVHALIERPSNLLWICTDRNGIFQYDGFNFTPLNNNLSQLLKYHNCNAGLAVHDSLLVFGTILNGLIFSDGSGNILKTYNYTNGLNNNTVLSLFMDSGKGLWVGLDEGATYINTGSPFRLFSDVNGTLGTVYSAVKKDTLLYLGTNHGLFVCDIRHDKGQYHFENLGIIPGAQGQVWKIFEYGDRLLCGHNEGTFIIKGRSIQKISDVTGGYCFTGYNTMLLQGTYTGIVSFRKDSRGDWQYQSRVKGFSEPTRYLEIDYLGYVWAVHPQKGLYRLELNEEADSLVSLLHFNSIADTSEKISMAMVNNQLLFMTSTAIYTFDYENRRFQLLQTSQRSLGEYLAATRIIHHEKSSYWFMMDDRLALFDINRSFEARKIAEFEQKYISLPGREQQIIALDRNTMLIPTRQAFSTVNLNLLIESAHPGTPVISRLHFSGKDRNIIIMPQGGIQPSVPNRQHNLTVFISDAARFDINDKVFLYRIPEIEDEWHQTTHDQFTYLNLNHGYYHLQVKAATGYDIAETAFTIRRPWYLSIVAGIIYLLTVALLVWLGTRLFRFELDRHRRLVEYEISKNKLESELDHKSYELMLTMRYLIRKTEILKELKIQIDAMKSDSSKYPVKFVREMERIIREGLDSQTEEWKNAMNNLKLSQEGFFRKLKEKYSNLTPNDLRLCSYLRMNFTTKEMAHLLNISARAVEIGRYRLRQKLKLDHHINLTEYLIREAE
jgi:ligand-binding sensor domain-containing protein